MTEKAHAIALRVLRKDWEKVSELEKRVLHAVASRLSITRKAPDACDTRTGGERMADAVARFGGSWTFVITFFVVLALWMILNSLWLATRAFDPFPYILLNLILSCLAAVQAPIILMSQNREAQRDRLRAEHDYEVNLKAELEIMQLHDMIEALREEIRGDRGRTNTKE